LLHQWTTVTAASIANTASPHPFWAIDCPKVAFANQHIMHLILAFSALHKAQACQNMSDVLRTTATQHFNLGLRQTHTALTQLSTSNAHAIYISAILICFCTFAFGPSDDEFLFFSSSNNSGSDTWYSMIRGVRVIIEAMGNEFIHDADGPLKTLVTGPGDDPQVIEKKRSYIVCWQDPIRRLRENITACSEHQQIYLKALERLFPALEAVWGKTTDLKETLQPNREVTIFAWLYLLEDDFVNRLGQRDQVALLILGYYALLLEELKCFWFMIGWPEHLMAGVRRYVDEEHMSWVEWPIQKFSIT